MRPVVIKSICSIVFLSTFILFNLNCSEKETTDFNNAKTDVSSDILAINTLDSTANTMNYQENEMDKMLLLFVGTYSTGIYVYELDTNTGQLHYVTVSPNTSNPSYLTVHPNKKWIYSVNENYSGTISAFSFDSVNLGMTFINSVSSEGSSPCYVSIDNTGKYILVANYTSGNVSVCPINVNGSLGASVSSDQHTGSGPVAGRQDGPHAHMIIQAENNFIYNTDLGIDKILVYNFDTITGNLSSAGYDASSVPGAGPRHIAFHPSQPWMYAVCELSGTIESYNVDNLTGELTRFDTISALPDGVTADAASADIHISPDGKYLYASNRGTNNNIAMYSIDQSTGELTLMGHQPAGGSGPRNFVIDPAGKFFLVACQNSNKIITYRIEEGTGLLLTTGSEVTVTSPVCLKFFQIHKEKATTAIKEYTE